MSIYQKFIESSTREQARSQPDRRLESSSHTLNRSPIQTRQSRYHQAPVESQVMLKQKSRAHLAALSPLASAVGSTISSTPISHRQYKRLVEASDTQTYQNFQSPCTNHYHQIGHTPYPMQSSQHIQHYHNHHHHQQLQPKEPQSFCEQRYQQQQQQRQQQSLSLADIHLQQQRASAGHHMSLHRSQANIYQSHEHLTSQLSSSVSAVKQRKQKLNMASTDDPVLLKWMQAMRFETELECLTALQARTLAIDEHSAAALSVRNSQVAIQEMRLESDLVLDMIDTMIDSLPVNFNTIDKLAIDFSEIYARLMEQTKARSSASASALSNKTNHTYCNQLNNLTIINCTPRKSLVSSRTLRPLDELAVQIRDICMKMANSVQKYQDNYNSYEHIENGLFEAMLREIKLLVGRFTEISIRTECANIVRALDHDFSKSSQLSRLASNVSLRPVRPYESSSMQLPLKWALIALWQLTKEDGYICRVLTERWQCSSGAASTNGGAEMLTPASKPSAAKRLDYSTKYDNDNTENSKPPTTTSHEQHSLRSDYEKLYQLCSETHGEQFLERQRQQQQMQRTAASHAISHGSPQGALSSALKSKQPIKQVSTIELLIEIIISQPNRHERADVLSFMQSNKLVDLEDLDQSISAAFYTSNQYKVAALRILNHLCINDQAVKTILRCFSTPPPKQGQPIPENKIIKSIFECYQTAQEHIYQNETVFNINRTPSKRHRKRLRQQPRQDLESEEYSDYGSRQTTNSVPTSDSINDSPDDNNSDDEGDDAVVKEAIQLLIQLTTPFYKSPQGHDYYVLIGQFSIDSLVKYLTNIIKTTTNRKMLLLSLSALANISFIKTEPIKHYGTNGIILEMFRASKSRSKDLELRDQAITILANMSDKNVLDIVSNGGLTFLLSSLEICPTRMANYKLPQQRIKPDPYSNIDENGESIHDPNQTRRNHMVNKPRDRKPINLSDEFFDDLDCACDNQQSTLSMQSSCLGRLTANELAALERIHQKTAVAFARMSIDQVTTKMVEEYGGVKQMIDLCKLSHKRNHSDTVLIACLAALRRMSKVIGRNTFRHHNALDLIELEPDRAIEIYGRLYASEV